MLDRFWIRAEGSAPTIQNDASGTRLLIAGRIVQAKCSAASSLGGQLMLPVKTIRPASGAGRYAKYSRSTPLGITAILSGLSPPDSACASDGEVTTTRSAYRNHRRSWRRARSERTLRRT